MSAEVLSYLPSSAVMGREVVSGLSPGEMLATEAVIDINHVPMNYIPPLDLLWFVPEKFDTADHEWKHVFAADGKFRLISVIPDAVSYGRTLLMENIDLKALQVVAAGSMALGPAWGTSGDEVQIRVVDLIFGNSPGSSMEWAKLQARSKINQYSVHVRSYLSKMLVYLGEITSRDFPLILERARFEAKLKAQGRYDEFVKAYTDKGEAKISFVGEKDIDLMIKTAEECAVKEFLANGDVKITNYRYGQEIDSLVRCGICGGFNGQHNQEIHRIYELRHRNFFDAADNDPMRVQEKELVPAGFGFIDDEDQPKSKAGIIFKNPFSKN